MSTEPAASTVYAEVQGRSRAVIESELQRLARRVRRLSEHDLSTIESTLDELAEQLILERLRSMPDRAEQLGRLFATDDLVQARQRQATSDGESAVTAPRSARLST